MQKIIFPEIFNSLLLKVVKTQGNCKYHPVVGQEIRLNKALPIGLCPFLYVSAYPYALSLLYDGEFSWRKKVDKDTVIGQCQMPSNQMVFLVRRRKNHNLDPEKLKKFEEERHLIFIELIDKKGSLDNCSDCFSYSNMVVGRHFEFNRGDLPEICPAAFNQMFPVVIQMILSNSKKTDKTKFACPDPKTNVIFELRYI